MIVSIEDNCHTHKPEITPESRDKSHIAIN